MVHIDVCGRLHYIILSDIFIIYREHTIKEI